MRCHRCHAKIDSGRKTCPNCGTLVRKRRGSINVAPELGGGKLTSAVKGISSRVDFNFDPKILLLCVAAVAVVAFFVGVSRCDSCSSCSGCSSCASCSSCSSCASCSSCSSCASCDGCSACAEKKQDDNSPYGKEVNGAALSREYYRDGVLYYVDGQSLVALTDAGALSVMATGSGIGSVCADDKNIYYLSNGNLWSTPIEKPTVVSDDPNDRYASVRILNATVSGSDAGVTSIYGYGISDGYICYWGPNAGGGMAICRKPLGGGETLVLRTGAYHMVQCYRGSVYFLGREEADYGMLYKIDLATGEKTIMYTDKVYYFTLSSGGIYAVTWENHIATLHRVDIETGEVEREWVIEELSGIVANDSYIYYCVTTDGSGHIYRMSPDGTGRREIFFDDSTIQLSGLAGDYFSVWLDVNMAADTAAARYADASYYVVNGESGEKFIID